MRIYLCVCACVPARSRGLVTPLALENTSRDKPFHVFPASGAGGGEAELVRGPSGSPKMTISCFKGTFRIRPPSCFQTAQALPSRAQSVAKFSVLVI